MPTASSMQALIIKRFIPYEKSTEQLQTIDLCVTNVWFTAYKAIVYVEAHPHPFPKGREP